MTPTQVNDMVNYEDPGWLRVSETSSDMRDLAGARGRVMFARRKRWLWFCYQARKFVGAFAAALGGLETLVFAGGIGVKMPPRCARVSARGWVFLGLKTRFLTQRGASRWK